MKPSVYLETTVVSYFVSRPSRDLIVAAHQQITNEWWENVLPYLDVFISAIVIDEITRGDNDLAKRRMEIVSSFNLVDMTDGVRHLAELYYDALNIPEKARADSFHLALASWHELDFLVSWKCTHIASARVRKIIETSNDDQKLRTPLICTPEELMEF